jgi:hypothetical protein
MVCVVDGDDTLEGVFSFLFSGVGLRLSGRSDRGVPALDLRSHPSKVSFNLTSIYATFGGRPISLSRPITAIA